MVKGLATVIYGVTDLEKAKAWYASAFQQAPYFDQPFYVGFNIGGYELGLDPNFTVGKPGAGGTVAYWRVAEIEPAVQQRLPVVPDVAQAAVRRQDERGQRRRELRRPILVRVVAGQEEERPVLHEWTADRARDLVQLVGQVCRVDRGE